MSLTRNLVATLLLGSFGCADAPTSPVTSQDLAWVTAVPAEAAPPACATLPSWTHVPNSTWSEFAWGDIDGDGFDDLLVGSTHRLELFRSTGPTLVLDWETTLPLAVFDLSFGDIDGDGDQDFVVLHDPTGNVGGEVVRTYENTGADFVPWPIEIDEPGRQGTVDLGDIDGDGKDDLVLGLTGSLGYEDGEVLVLESNANNTWTQTWASGWGEVTVLGGVELADADGDGDLDMGVVNDDFYYQNGEFLGFYLNQGGVLRHKADLTVSSPRSVAFGDADNDGDMEIVITRGDRDYAEIYLNTGRGVTKVATLSGDIWTHSPGGVEWGDFNGDGFNDLVIANQFSDQQQIFINNGLGADIDLWTAGVTFDKPYDVSFGDMNNDGAFELAVASRSLISVFSCQ